MEFSLTHGLGNSRIIHGDMREVLANEPEGSVHAVVTDPPYGLSFMGKGWDHQVPGVDYWSEVFRVLKPGGHVLAFGGTRTFHRMACAIEDAGFEMRDTMMWLYGTGFPKSHNVGKAIDALIMTGGSAPKNMRQRDMGDDYKPHVLAGTPGYGDGRMSRGADTDRDYLSAPPVSSIEAASWQGWGTALKPAWEPIIMARKPLIGTVAKNVMEHGTGAINVDACRVPGIKDVPASPRRAPQGSAYGDLSKDLGTGGGFDPNLGRWPANVVHDGSDEVEAAFAEFGEKASGKPGVQRKAHETHSMAGRLNITGKTEAGFGDSGSASRFFYSSKASAADRGDSKHPTVKPISLMRWLVRMVTPPGGIVLDPFAGSGTTGEAAIEEGFIPFLIEREEEYVQDIQRRMDAMKNKGKLL